MRRTATATVTAAAVATAVLLAACGGAPSSIGSSGEPDEVLRDVDYYYACGNEVLELPDGRTFYPLFPQPQGLAASEAVVVLVADLAVPAPEVGDDTGTLTIRPDGTARWRSDSGITAVLTDEPQTYEFVC